MEDVIIGLLFVYFFVIRPLLKQVRKGDAKQPGARPRAPLGMLIEKVREKMQEIAEEAAAVRREKAQMHPVNTRKELFTEVAQSPDLEPWEAAPDPQEVSAWPPEESWSQAQPETSARGWAVADPGEPEAVPRAPAAVVQAAPARRPARYGVNLRQAVVWSEILGPPVSLRDGG